MTPTPKKPSEITAEFADLISESGLSSAARAMIVRSVRTYMVDLLLEAKERMPKELTRECGHEELHPRICGICRDIVAHSKALSEAHSALDALILEVKQS